MTSSSRGAAVYFESAVLIIGIIGTAANGLVLYALVASKEHKKHMLIVNQNALDLFSCILLVITYGMKLFNIYLTGSLGYWLCMLLGSQNLLWCGVYASFSLLWCGVYASFSNLAAIAIERYLMVVHSAWYQNHLSKWMMYSAMAFIWISSFVHVMAVAFVSSAVIDGACYGFVIWKNRASGVAYGIYSFLSAYVIVLAIFIFCYGKIVMVIHRQASVMAGHSAAGSGVGEAQLNHIQSNITKTMILVCAFYAVAWLPENVYFLLMSLDRS